MASSWSLPKVTVSVESGLESPGNTIAVADRIDVDSIEMGGRTIELEDGLTYDVALTNTGEGILATGIVRGACRTECDRCLAPAEFDLASEVACYYLREEPEEDVDDEEDFGLIDVENGTVDLSEAIQSSIAMDIPFVILCRDDCKGLCPVCGANLNEVDCGCVVEPDPDFERPNPFAVLAGFTFADGTTVADHAKELEELDEAAGEGLEDDLDDEEFEVAWEERQKAEGEGSGAGV